MAGLLVLAGGAEFEKGMDGADRFLMEQAGGPDAPIVILPTAGGADGGEQMAARRGTAWFRQLGGRNVEAVMVVDRQSANDPTLAGQIAQAKLIYMAGGSPGFLLEALRGSAAWEACLKAWENGAILGGSSAGAMVLTEQMYDPNADKLVTGLGLVKAGAFLPHHNNFGRRWFDKLHKLSPAATLIGVDEKTAVIGSGNQWRVYGKGWVTVYRAGQPFKFVSGQPFKLSD